MGHYDELKEAIDSAQNEREIGQYLKNHLELLRILNEHSWNCVIIKAEFPIGQSYRADFIILSACSGYWNCVLVEMQSPHDTIYTKKKEESKGLREARRQLQDWSKYINENKTTFRAQLAALAVDKPAQCSNAQDHLNASSELRDPETCIMFKYKVLIGRRSFLDNQANYRRSLLSEIEIVTFDRLLEYARKLDT